MNVVQWVGLALAIIGVVEFALFSQLSRTRSNIEAKKPILYANSAINVFAGLMLILIFQFIKI